MITQVSCSRCYGLGKWLGEKCDACDGVGAWAWGRDGNPVKPVVLPLVPRAIPHKRSLDAIHDYGPGAEDRGGGSRYRPRSANG